MENSSVSLLDVRKFRSINLAKFGTENFLPYGYEIFADQLPRSENVEDEFLIDSKLIWRWLVCGRMLMVRWLYVFKGRIGCMRIFLCS